MKSALIGFVLGGVLELWLGIVWALVLTVALGLLAFGVVTVIERRNP